MKMEDYLRAQHAESTPSWLITVERDAADVQGICRNFLASRLVYYPGSGRDGDPVTVFNRSGAAHCFIYVDYGIPRSELEVELQAGFRGYESLLRLELTEADLATEWVGHIPSSETDRGYRAVPPYGFIEIFQRKAELDGTHGAERFAVLFLSNDAYIAFDMLFCQDSGVPSPFCVVLQDHGFGGGYGTFGRGGLMEQVAAVAHVRPSLLLVGQNTEPWNGYQRCDADPADMGEHRAPRRLFEISNAGRLIPRS